MNTKARYTNEKIASAMGRLLLGRPAKEVCWEMSISRSKLRACRRKFAVIDAKGVHRLRQLEVQNRQLQQSLARCTRLIAELAVDEAVLHRQLRPKS